MVQVRFDRLPGGPGDDARFIELEDDTGAGIQGEWVQDGDTWLLKIPGPKVMPFNINDHVKVKILPEGESRMARNHMLVRGRAMRPFQRDAEGWTEMQLWELMRKIGSYMQMGWPLVCETEIQLILER